MTTTRSRARAAGLLFAGAAATAIGLAMPAYGDDQFSETWFFGDSNTDAGFFRPLLPASVRPVTGQFTTNAGFVWSQFLADYLGTSAAPNGNGQTGTNYAAGGSRVSINSTGALGPIPSLATQVNTYLTARGGAADANALYTVFGGWNDIFAITNAGADPTTTIAAAATGLRDIVSTLNTAGARYIMVATVPDIGLTPAFRAQGATAQANGTSYSASLSQQTFANIAGAGLRVIPLDMFTFSQELVANAAGFGFTNVTGTACQPQITANSLTCNPTSVVNADARNTYLYADGVHYTVRAHDLIAQYALSILEAPRLIASLPHTASVSGYAEAERVFDRMAGRRGEGVQWWIDVRSDMQQVEDASIYDGEVPSFLAGVDVRNGALTYGGFLGAARGDFDFANGAGGYDVTELSLGAYAGWQSEGAWVRAQASYSALAYDIDRDVTLAGRISIGAIPMVSLDEAYVQSEETLGGEIRRHSGSPNGHVMSLGLNAGWEFTDGPLTHGPVLGVLAQWIEIDGYAESNAGLSTALAYPSQSFDSLLVSAGWQVEWAMDETAAVFGKAAYLSELGDAPEEAFARSQTIPGATDYAVPNVDYDTDFASATIGVRADLNGARATLGVTSTFGRGTSRDATVFFSFGGSF